MRLRSSFYQRDDVVQISQDLLGKFLVTEIDGFKTAGMIVETEAYAGEIDRASHAFGGRRTKRTEVMFGAGGSAYVYLIYGMYHLFNVVTNVAGIPHAILIRAIEPADGLDVMLQRRGMPKTGRKLTAGPGVLSQALGITTAHTGTSLVEGPISIEDRGVEIAESEIVASPRVRVEYAQDHAEWPYRFRVGGSGWTSPAN
jgi:DNA-3-methyladenine glycosylase